MKTSNPDVANAFLNDLLVRLRLTASASDGPAVLPSAPFHDVNRLYSFEFLKAATRFLVSQLNALVLYVGARSLSESTLPSSELNPQAAMELYRYSLIALSSPQTISYYGPKIPRT